MRGTFGVNTENIGSGSVTTLPAYGSTPMQFADLERMISAGHEIGSHNITNTNVSAGLAAYMGEYRTAKWDLHSRGLLNAGFYHPFVQGVSSAAAVTAMLAEGVRVQRLVSTANAEPTFRESFLTSVPVRNLDTSQQLGTPTTALSLLSALQDCIDYGTDLIVMGHLLSASGYGAVTWPVADFTALVDAVKAAKDSGQIGGAGSIGEWCAYRGFQVA